MTGKESANSQGKDRIGPEIKYGALKVPYELNAEFLRTILTYINTAKTISPEAVAYIRELIRKDPVLGKKLRLNSLPSYLVPRGENGGELG